MLSSNDESTKKSSRKIESILTWMRMKTPYTKFYGHMKWTITGSEPFGGPRRASWGGCSLSQTDSVRALFPTQGTDVKTGVWDPWTHMKVLCLCTSLLPILSRGFVAFIRFSKGSMTLWGRGITWTRSRSPGWGGCHNLQLWDPFVHLCSASGHLGEAVLQLSKIQFAQLWWPPVISTEGWDKDLCLAKMVPRMALPMAKGQQELLRVRFLATSQPWFLRKSRLQMWEWGHEEGCALKNWCFWIVVLEKTLESPLDCKQNEPVNPEGSQPSVFTGRTDAEAETPMSDHLLQWANSLEQTLMLGKIEGRRRRGDRGWNGWMASLTQWTWVWAAVHGVINSQTQLSNWTTIQHQRETWG